MGKCSKSTKVLIKNTILHIPFPHIPLKELSLLRNSAFGTAIPKYWHSVMLVSNCVSCLRA
jgi:hypothetical protein